jgi:ER membrane protein complex subunit 2
MEFTAAVQKLGAYQPRSSPRSKEILQSGIGRLRKGQLTAQAEAGERQYLL